MIALTLPLADTDRTVDALLKLFSADVVPVAHAVDVKQDLEEIENVYSDMFSSWREDPIEVNMLYKQTFKQDVGKCLSLLRMSLQKLDMFV